MEAVRNIAESYYNTGSPEVQEKANEFFNSMVVDESSKGPDKGKKVDLEEFLTFMRSQGYSKMHNNSFFKKLDATGHGRLDFMDVMTLYYIIKSGRPFCDCCAEFIPSTFFSCLTCFSDSLPSFIICCDCHYSKISKHQHHGLRAPFLDNYALLHATKLHSPTTTTTKQTIAATQTTPNQSVVRTRQQSATAHPPPPVVLDSASTVSTSASAAHDYIMNEFNKVTAQYQCKGGQKPSVTATVATASTPSMHRVNPANGPELAPQNAMVRANQQPLSWMKIASASFKALDTMITVGSTVTTLTGCTIL